MDREPESVILDGELYCWIPVGKNDWALVDEADRELVSQYKWLLTTDGYVYTTIKENGKSRRLTMHRLICPSKAPQLDHENHDKKDNRHCNIRESTHAQNQQNRLGPSRRSTTGIRNVYRTPNGWIVRIGVKGKVVHIGSYPDERIAERVAIWARSVYFTHALECNGGPRPTPPWEVLMPEDAGLSQ